MNLIKTSEKSYQPGGLAELLVMALPMIVSNACDTLMIFADRLFLARVSAEAMNAALGAGTTYFLVTTFFLGLIGYSTALVAQYFGAKRPGFCSVAFTQALIIALIATPIIFLMRPLVNFYFNSVGLSEIQLPLQLEYFNVVCYAALFSMLRPAFAGFFTGTGRTKIVMIATLIAMVVNIIANYVLIFGKCGFPALGVTGAALGTIIGMFCSTMVYIWAYMGKTNRMTYQVAQSFKFVPLIMKKLLRYGSPTGLEFLLSMIAFNGIVMVFHSQGDVVATALTIMFNWDLVAFLPLIGLEISVMSMVGRYMGAQTPGLAKKSAYSGLKLGSIYCFIMLVAFLVFPQALVNMFANDSDPVFVAATPIAVDMLRIAGIYVMANAFMVIFTGVLRGAGDTLWPMGFAIAVNWAALASTFVLLHIFNTSAQWAWLSFAVLFVLCSFAYLWRFKKGKWQQLRII